LKRHLIVFDVDDTLIPVNRPINPSTAQKFALIAKDNVRILLTSGKPAVYLAAIARMLGLHNAILIGENGSVIWFDSIMPTDYIRHVLEDNQLFELKRARQAIKDHFREAVFFQPNIVNVTAFPFFDTGVKPTQIESFLHTLGLVDVDIYTNVDSVDCVPKGIDKGKALSLVMKKFDFTSKKVIVVGDGINDLPMFQIVETSICVGDSTLLKQFASYSVDTIDEALDLILSKLI
jgi:HAD superfamily hydrolase (TIGR01484 family)